MKVRIPNQGPSRNDMLKQVQKMQEDIAALQEDLDNREYEAVAGGGAVTVKVNGKHLITSLHIKPEAVDPEDPEMLEDLITVAVNEAVEKATNTAEEEMSAVTGGLNIPGMPGMF